LDAGSKRKLIIAFVFLAILAGLAAVFLDSNYREAAYSLRGRSAKNFDFMADGKTEQLSDHPPV
jgi:hypothetical protein